MKIKKIEVIGLGENCPKCEKPMERRKHRDSTDKIYFYSKWDYCKNCYHVQHYPEFKSPNWKVQEERQEHLFDIMKEI